MPKAVMVNGLRHSHTERWSLCPFNSVSQAALTNCLKLMYQKKPLVISSQESKSKETLVQIIKPRKKKTNSVCVYRYQLQTSAIGITFFSTFKTEPSKHSASNLGMRPFPGKSPVTADCTSGCHIALRAKPASVSTTCLLLNRLLNLS